MQIYLLRKDVFDCSFWRKLMLWPQLDTKNCLHCVQQSCSVVLLLFRFFLSTTWLKWIQFQFASCMSEGKKKKKKDKLPSFPALPYYWFSGEISTRSSWSSSLWKGSPCEAGGKRRFFCSSSVKTHSSLTIAHTILNYYVDPSLNQLLAFFFPQKNNQGRINKGWETWVYKGQLQYYTYELLSDSFCWIIDAKL